MLLVLACVRTVYNRSTGPIGQKKRRLIHGNGKDALSESETQSRFRSPTCYELLMTPKNHFFKEFRS